MTDKEIEIQYALGSLPIKMLWKLAYNKKTSPRILDVLSDDEDLNMISNIAYNPNTPEHTLFKIFRKYANYHPGESFGYDLSRNPSTPVKLLVKLSKSRHSAIRSNVARNPNAPKEILIILSKDKDRWIRHVAVKQLRLKI